MKKINLKLIALFFIGFACNLKAQVNEKMYSYYKKEYREGYMRVNAQKRDSVIKNAEFIFEGKVIQSGGVWNDTIQYGCGIIRIEKVYRGHDKLKPGIIEVINFTNNVLSYEGTIVFGNSIENFTSCFPNQKFDNSTKINLSGSIFSMSPQTKEMTGLYDLYFKIPWQARRFISKYPDIKVVNAKSQKNNWWQRRWCEIRSKRNK